MVSWDDAHRYFTNSAAHFRDRSEIIFAVLLESGDRGNRSQHGRVMATSTRLKPARILSHESLVSDPKGWWYRPLQMFEVL